ncbi:MAG: hypothetical protein OXG07_05625 [Anaerolineaceae bacterium]|nr:hypothetical protein [Anaerolineaceae bacterium]MCY3906762.1 hypothetical protein [Anaerolineaceae bacterium]
MRAFRLLVRVVFVVLAVWLLLPALAAYNDVILTWYNFLLDDPLVDPLTLDDVEARHGEIFGPVVLPRLILFVLLIVLTWTVLRSTRPARGAR